DRQSRIDLQLRLEALGNELGLIDGTLGSQTREAIGIWQADNGLPQTTYLTREQLAFLVIQSDPVMAAVRAGYDADQARTAQQRKPVVQKARAMKPVAQGPRKQRQVAQKWRDREIMVRRDEPARPRDNF
ncbi:peptidoglycan-binding protein, partial [bacterium M00.F.Ca.ET.180.01.1.1]